MVLELAIEGRGTLHLSGYTNPHVIMEHLATDFPEPLITKLYTSGYAQRTNVVYQSEQKPVIFPSELLIRNLVPELTKILTAASVPHVVEPKTIDDKTELAIVTYKPREGPASSYFSQTFIPLLYAAIGTFKWKCRGVEIDKPGHWIP